MQQRAPAPVVRLGLAALLAGIGAVLVLIGLVAMLSPAPPGRGDTSIAIATAAAATSPSASPPVADASPVPSTAASPAGPPASAGPGTTVRLVGAGDIARCDGTADEATAALVAATPGVVFTLGDNAYERGTAKEFKDCFGPSWGTFKDRIELPVVGNHDYGTKDAGAYRDYFGAAAVRDGKTWYSQDIGAWHVVVLDSDCAKIDGGCGPDSPQVAWLRQDLAASSARCTVALFHHPRFSSGTHGSDADVAPFWDALYEAGAELILNGHEHSYERFGAQDPDGRADPGRGIVELVVGTGGAELRGFGAPVANSLVRSSLAYGVMVLDLSPGGYTWRFVSTDGSFSDTGSGTCH